MLPLSLRKLSLCATVFWIAAVREEGGRLVQANAGCALHNWCNGHGTCDTTTATCSCYEGWGADSDTNLYRSPDCSTRTCPAGHAWGSVPTDSETAHPLAECSNRGKCNRVTGDCACFEGFQGGACERSVCPNECSGHGRCLSMKTMATLSEALPLSNVTSYSGESESSTWDEDKIFGCVCDSSWEVGLGAGQTQEPEWHGPDCSLRHCPSGDDPVTLDKDETDCYNVTTSAAYETSVGRQGNLCHVDCAGRGLCNYDTGLCTCFSGFYGKDCTLQSVLAKG